MPFEHQTSADTLLSYGGKARRRACSTLCVLFVGDACCVCMSYTVSDKWMDAGGPSWAKTICMTAARTLSFSLPSEVYYGPYVRLRGMQAGRFEWRFVYACVLGCATGRCDAQGVQGCTPVTACLHRRRCGK